MFKIWMNVFVVVVVLLKGIANSNYNGSADSKPPLLMTLAMKVMAANVKAACKDLPLAHNYETLIRNMAKEFGKISAKDVILIATGKGENLKDKICEYSNNAADLTYDKGDVMIEIIKAYFKNVMNTMAAHQMLQLITGPTDQVKQILILAMDDACEMVPNSEEKCKLLIPLQQCVAVSLSPQNTLNALFQSAGISIQGSHKGVDILGAILKSVINLSLQ